MESYESLQDYLTALQKRTAMPAGFECSTVGIDFLPREKPAVKPYRMNVCLIAAERPTPLFGAMFTQNAFPGYPVIIGRERLKSSEIRALLINNRISNVRVPEGRDDADRLLESLAELLECPAEQLMPFSTGIIGWRLPVEDMEKSLGPLVDGLSSAVLLPVSRAIMTTDSYPKMRSIQLGEGRILGIAKGAGMIEPNMATMLVFLLTDLTVTRKFLREALKGCVESTFNRITVDGDQSTSDSVVMLSSGVKPPVDEEEFRKALMRICWKLSEDIVRNGEGTNHVMEVQVAGASDEEVATGAAKAIANSPLVKTAIFGNDPNVGRIINALGDYMGSLNRRFDPLDVSINLGGIDIFEAGFFTLDSEKEGALTKYLADCAQDTSELRFPRHDRNVEINVRIGDGKFESRVLGSDLSYGYIKENAEYRS
jgi:glutamate N-acetyltransferase/amino-acid N-acetyltransferase